MKAWLCISSTVACEFGTSPAARPCAWHAPVCQLVAAYPRPLQWYPLQHSATLHLCRAVPLCISRYDDRKFEAGPTPWWQPRGRRNFFFGILISCRCGGGGSWLTEGGPGPRAQKRRGLVLLLQKSAEFPVTWFLDIHYWIECFSSWLQIKMWLSIAKTYGRTRKLRKTKARKPRITTENQGILFLQGFSFTVYAAESLASS